MAKDFSGIIAKSPFALSVLPAYHRGPSSFLDLIPRVGHRVPMDPRRPAKGFLEQRGNCLCEPSIPRRTRGVRDRTGRDRVYFPRTRRFGRRLKPHRSGHDAGFLKLRKDGLWSLYSVDPKNMDECLLDMTTALVKMLGSNPIAVLDLERLQKAERVGPGCVENMHPEAAKG